MIMEKNSATGVCFCNDLVGLPKSTGISELVSYSKKFKGISKIWYESEIDALNPNQISDLIRTGNLERTIIVGKYPGHLKSMFSRAMMIAGKDPGKVFLADLSHFNFRSSKDIACAKVILSSTIQGISFDFIDDKENGTVYSDTLVIGAGIAGIQAAIEIANSGNKVYLVEKEASIGGHMAMFDKKLPALGYAACILTPNRIQVDQRLNIELLT